MSQDEAIAILNHLIATSKDGETGFLEAARHAHAPSLRLLFADFSAACGRSAVELQDCVTMLCGTAEVSGTASAVLHRGWMNLRASLSSNEDLALLEECERGEAHAHAQYAAALDAGLAPAVRRLLQRQQDGALRHGDRIRTLCRQARADAA
ncbi:MAG: PA2169 family four-helix-bundle protein [Nevskia sp.]